MRGWSSIPKSSINFLIFFFWNVWVTSFIYSYQIDPCSKSVTPSVLGPAEENVCYVHQRGNGKFVSISFFVFLVPFLFFLENKDGVTRHSFPGIAFSKCSPFP